MTQLSTLIDNLVRDEDGQPVGAIDEIILSRSGHVERVVIRQPDRTRFCLTWADLRIAPQGIVIRANSVR